MVCATFKKQVKVVRRTDVWYIFDTYNPRVLFESFFLTFES